MRVSKSFLGGVTAIVAALSLAACGGGTETETSDENTAVTDIDPGEGDGTINDTTLIDGTIGAEEAMGMESRMPADAADAPAAPSGSNDEAGAETDAPAEPDPEPEAEAPAPEPEASEPEETAAEE
ncbi:hypothetical protein HFP51_06245 [Parasphingopyxis sp. CP4]|uniref:hypothetical protein n=1 Tax=Parasphingopyxis sp. CP4 TaxID=2724527 RepID=UPI0015A2AA37|nr:hypothetical protein [Parasphingopyxis sp. CP4]QLC21811.1 hypothetical protein HFP51_06245 [Parasphingopyxis sp. CP4]